MNLLNVVRGISGEVEIGRSIVAVSGIAAVITPIVFEAFEIGWNGGHFDVAAWCLAYPGGLGALVTAGILSVGSKDKSVATARQTTAQTTGDQA